MSHYTDKNGLSDCTILKRNRDQLGYGRGHADALRRLKAGEQQQLCARCQRYTWPDHRRLCEDFVADGPVIDTPADEAAIEELINDQ